MTMNKKGNPMGNDVQPTEKIKATNQLWVSDITYVKVWLNEQQYVFSYLSLIMKAYSHEIIG